MSRVGVAVFGVGRMGQVHLKHLVEEGRAEVVYLVDSPAEADRVQGLVRRHRLQGETEFASIERTDQVMADSRVKAVFVCTPTDQHEALIEKALQAGKHVMTEKPMTFSVEKARHFYSESAKRGLILFCAFNRRYDPGLKKVKKSISDGDLGKLLTIKICNRDPSAACSPSYLLKSGDIFHDSMVHGFDMVYFLSNQKPHSIVAFGHAHDENYAKLDDVDNAAVMLKYASGLVAIIENSRKSAYGYDQRVEVAGTKGMTVLENPVAFQLELRTSQRTSQEPTDTAVLTRYMDSYRAEVTHFLDAVLGLGSVEDPDGGAVTLGLRLADLSTASLRSGQVLQV